jgi:exopolyphosphatase/guanosine-5'-triphosphate,3'-diphosphate pyrophosphatase
MLKDKVTNSEWDKLKDWLKNYNKYPTPIICIGSGGNINKIAKLYGDRNDSYVPLDILQKAYQHLSSFTLKERIEDLGLRPDRADVIVPAAKIYIKVLQWANIDKIYVPKIGLSDGIVYNLYENIKNHKKDINNISENNVKDWLKNL